MFIPSLVIGIIHTFFGLVLIGLQVACYTILNYYYQYGLFEGRVAPGAWLGSAMFIAGIIGIVHGCSDPQNVQRFRRLRIAFVVFNIIVAVLSVIMLVLAFRWKINDPEGFLFEDCEFPVAPWIYYYNPHCEAEVHVKIMGVKIMETTMMIIACFEALVGFVGAIIVWSNCCLADPDKLRREQAYLELRRINH